MKSTTSYIANLTPLRGIAAILVVICHYEDFLVRFVPQSSTMFISKSYLMVDLFFIMSGFVITHAYQENFRDKFSKSDFKKFISSRFARIYPLHLFTLAIIVLGFLASGMKTTSLQDPAALPVNLFLLQACAFLNKLTWNGPSWSISAEWWSYMLFPFLILFLNTKKKIAIPLFLIFSVFTYLSIMYWLPRDAQTSLLGKLDPHNINVFYDYGFLRGLSGFLIGMILYKVYEISFGYKIFQADWSFLLFSLATILCMHFAVSDIYCIPFLAGIVFCAANNKGRINKFFELRPLQIVGEISYSIYMIHIIILFIVIDNLKKANIKLPERPFNDVSFWPGLFGCLGFLVLIISLSYLSYRFVEKPSRDLINKWMK